MRSTDPQAAGGDFKITASCNGCNNGNASTYTTAIEHVTFGDVWYCGGQSNMALPLSHTMSRNISRDLILSGKYANIRLHGIAGNMNPAQPWTTLKQALGECGVVYERAQNTSTSTSTPSNN